MIIIPLPGSAGRYYGVILYSKIKAAPASFRVRRDYDSCNKPISIGRHNGRARCFAGDFTLRAIYGKRRPSLTLSLSPSFFPFLPPFLHRSPCPFPRFYPRGEREQNRSANLQTEQEEMIIAPDPPCIPDCLPSRILGLDGGGHPRARSPETIEPLLIYHPVRMQRIPREINYCR